MIEFRLQMAGQVVNCLAMFEATRTYCKEYLDEGEIDFYVGIMLEDIAFEREKAARTSAAVTAFVKKLEDNGFLA